MKFGLEQLLANAGENQILPLFIMFAHATLRLLLALSLDLLTDRLIVNVLVLLVRML